MRHEGNQQQYSPQIESKRIGQTIKEELVLLELLHKFLNEAEITRNTQGTSRVTDRMNTVFLLLTKRPVFKNGIHEKNSYPNVGQQRPKRHYVVPSKHSKSRRHIRKHLTNLK